MLRFAIIFLEATINLTNRDVRSVVLFFSFSLIQGKAKSVLKSHDTKWQNINFHTIGEYIFCTLHFSPIAVKFVLSHGTVVKLSLYSSSLRGVWLAHYLKNVFQPKISTSTAHEPLVLADWRCWILALVERIQYNRWHSSLKLFFQFHHSSLRFRLP